MSVRSRAPWRPTLAEACSSFSTSAGVKYARVRRSRFEVRRGGVDGEGAARDLGAEAFLLRPLEATFPFWGIGACFWAARVRRELTGIFGLLAMAAEHNIPINGSFRECRTLEAVAAFVLFSVSVPRIANRGDSRGLPDRSIGRHQIGVDLLGCRRALKPTGFVLAREVGPPSHRLINVAHAPDYIPVSRLAL